MVNGKPVSPHQYQTEFVQQTIDDLGIESARSFILEELLTPTDFNSAILNLLASGRNNPHRPSLSWICNNFQTESLINHFKKLILARFVL